MTECTLDRLYYCPAKEKLAKGLNALQSECDYNDFIECAYGAEEPSTDDEEEENLQEEVEEDVDVDFQENDELEHEKDTFVLPSRGVVFTRGSGDKFV
ncbi:hypothetical protein L1887_38889 [Cichorium endivia]|nr:hypothetical protein L1887_38889 [Cichorium endivia]